MSLNRGMFFLNNRYEIVNRINFPVPLNYDCWLAYDSQEHDYLLKIWKYEGEEPSHFERALWDTELRKLYRLCSSPGADNTILTLREASVDRKNQCFVMVLKSEGGWGGFDLLSEALSLRKKYQWLKMNEISNRREIWKGLKRVAEGIKLIHEQKMLHRNVCAENIFINFDLGPSSFRLGGFEWSVRLGDLYINPLVLEGYNAPEFEKETVYQPETDWYGFGLLAIRCLMNIEKNIKNKSPQFTASLIQSLHSAPEELLTSIEKDVLLRLIEPSALLHFN